MVTCAGCAWVGAGLAVRRVRPAPRRVAPRETTLGCRRRGRGGIAGAYEQDRATRSAQETLRDAAEKQPPDTAAAMRTDHGQIDRMLDDVPLQPFGNILAGLGLDDFRVAVDRRVRDRPFRAAQHRRAIAPNLVEQRVGIHSSGVRHQKRAVDDENGEQARAVRSRHLQTFVERQFR